MSTELKLIPSENIAVVVLCNARNTLIYEIDNEILAVLLPKFGENLKQKNSRARRSSQQNFPPEASGRGVASRDQNLFWEHASPNEV